MIANFLKARIGFLEVKCNCKGISLMINKFVDHWHTDICKSSLMVEKLSPNFFEIIDQTNFTEYGFSHQKLLD